MSIAYSNRPVRNLLITDDCFEARWNLPTEIGTGFFRKMRIHQGFEVYCLDGCFRDFQGFDCRKNHPVFVLMFTISGRSDIAVNGVEKKISISDGQNLFFYLPVPESASNPASHEPIRGLSIHLDPDVFFKMVGSDLGALPKRMRAIADGKREPFYSRIANLTPGMHMAVHQIFNCPFRTIGRRLFIKSRATELVACTISGFNPAGETRGGKPPLTVSDIERIHTAKRLLTRDLRNPPNLGKLCRSAGLNHTKLILGFHEVYGASPFSLLRSIRMRRALELIDENQGNITEIAFAVG